MASLVTLLICEIETNVLQLSSSAEGTGTNLITASGRSDLVLEATEKEMEIDKKEEPQIIIIFLAWCSFQLSR